jgi:3-oxoacyl-[acyl-carrier protein] reductase
MARNNILVNALAPLAATRMSETIRTNAKFAANMMARIPLRRWAEPGQVLPVDGGMVM